MLFKHELGIFSCFSSCLSFSFISHFLWCQGQGAFTPVELGRLICCHFFSVSSLFWTQRTVLPQGGASSFKTLARFQSLLESFSRFKEAVFSYHCFLVCRSCPLVNSALALLCSAVLWSEGLLSMIFLALFTAPCSCSSRRVQKWL